MANYFSEYLENCEKGLHIWGGESSVKLPEKAGRGGRNQQLALLMAEKIILTELIAYSSLSDLIREGLISNRSAIISSYALCGFANFSSIGIQLGGLGTMAPNRKKDLSKIAFKAMIGGALASFLTATIAGILI